MRIEVCNLFRKPLPAAVIGLAAFALTSMAFAGNPLASDPFAPVPGKARPVVTGMAPDMEGPGMVMEPGMDTMGRPARRRSENLEDLPLNEVLAIALSSSPASKDIPKVERLVERMMALDHGVVVARAQLQEAQANLNRMQLEVAQRVIELRGRWEVARRSVEHLEAKLKAAGDKTNAELARAYINARAELAQIERQLPILADSMVPPQIYLYPSNNADSRLPIPTLIKPGEPSKHDATTSQPTGRDAEVVQPPKQMEMLIAIDFNETPLGDVVAYLIDRTKLNFVIDHSLDMDMPITLNLKDVPLKAVFQAIEDITHQICFLVRPYGILVIDRDLAAQEFGEKPGRMSSR